jgi:hypothetical protein
VLLETCESHKKLQVIRQEYIFNHTESTDKESSCVVLLWVFLCIYSLHTTNGIGKQVLINRTRPIG